VWTSSKLTMDFFLLFNDFMKRHNVVKFFEFMSTKKQSLLWKLCIFIKHINKVFCTPGLPTLFHTRVNLFTLLSVYFVNSLVMLLLWLLLCCYFSLYQCIWLYENKDIPTVWCQYRNGYLTCCIYIHIKFYSLSV
jgi:hypothetical protein